MKHNLLFSANGLCTPPCVGSQRKSSSSTLRNSLLTPLLMLFLLITGNSAVWAEYVTYDGSEDFYWNSHQKIDGSQWGHIIADNANVWLEFKNTSTNTTANTANGTQAEGNVWSDSEPYGIHTAKVPAGTWNQVTVKRGQQGSWSQNGSTFTLESGKNYIGPGDDGLGVYGSGSSPAGDTFEGGEVFYMKRNTIDKNGNSIDFLAYGRCDFNLYSADGSTWLSPGLQAEVIPNTDPAMLKFTVPAEHAGTVWGQVKVKQLEPNGTGHSETRKGDIPKDGKNYLINGNTMEWGTYVEPAVSGTTHTVTLHPNNGGSDIVRNSVPEGSTSSASELGLSSITYGVGTATWYTDPECTTPFSTVTSDMDLYAKWGVSGNYYVVGDLWMYDANGNWDNNKGQLMTNTNGVCTVTYTAPKGLNRIEIIKDKNWSQKINGGSYSSVLNASSPISLSENGGHIVFTLTEAKRVTITFDGKVSVSATDYTFDQSVDWRVKTSDTGWGNNPNSWDHSNVMTKTASGASIIIPNVPANTNHSFMITRGSNEQAVVGTYNFNALWLDTSNPSSGLTWNMQNTNIGDRQLAQTDNEWRNCSFRLSVQSDLRITFDGGVIRCDIVAPNVVTFNSNGGSAVASQEVSNGGTATEPSAPTKAGYTFVKWQLNGVDYHFTEAVTEDITLTAVWAYKAISSISLNESAHMTWVGNTDFELTYTSDPSDAIAKSVTWNSSNTSVATVSDGRVTAISAGTATITCTVTDQFDTQKTATCIVTVAACEMSTDNIYSMTVTGYNRSTGSSATLTDLWNESSNNGVMAQNARLVRIAFKDLATEYMTEDADGKVAGRASISDDSDKWMYYSAGTGLFYLQNYKTGHYLYKDKSTDMMGQNGDWKFYGTKAAAYSDADTYRWLENSSSGDLRICNKDGYNGGLNGSHTLMRYYVDAVDGWNTPYVRCGLGGHQGNNPIKAIITQVEASVANPFYVASQMNTSYYRMNTDATVQANLAAALVSGATITVRLYADAATTVKLTKTNGTDEVATINLTANTGLEYTYTVGDASPLLGENAFIIKASDNHAGIASIVVTRTYAADPDSPALAWETGFSGGVTQSVSGGTFQHYATSGEGSLGAITYSSSDETVATVAEDGTVTPLKEGTITITATIAAEGCYAEESITYDVTLNAATLAELIAATPASGTLTLTHDYNEDAVIDKAITINGGGHTIGNLTVEQTGDLTLESALTVNDFTICAKAGNTSTPAASGQVRNASDLTVNGNAYFLYTVDPSGTVHYGWYDFTVPFPVNAASGIKGYLDGVLKENFANGVDYAIMDYNGAKQALGQYPYKKFSGVMLPNQLYSITLDDEYNYNTLRMQKTADGALVASDNVTLNAYTGDATHQNWNGVGNGTLHHADADDLSSIYVQVYQSGDKTFLPVEKSEYSFVVGTAFMVQEAGSMTLNQATHTALLAPKRYADVPATAIQIAREGQPFSDQLFITASETGGQTYTPGVDLAKAGDLGSANVPQIWTTAYNSPLCVHEAQLIDGEASYNLSLYAPASGTYTLTSLNIPEDYTLYLTQNGTTLCNLSETYTLDLNKGVTTEYGLLLAERQQTPTGIDAISSQPSEIRKIMCNGVLYILHNGKVYNAQGAKVK